MSQDRFLLLAFPVSIIQLMVFKLHATEKRRNLMMGGRVRELHLGSNGKTEVKASFYFSKQQK